MRRWPALLALTAALVGCGGPRNGAPLPSTSSVYASTPVDFDAVPVSELRAGSGPLATVALATEAYLRSVGEDPDQYLLSKEPLLQDESVLYAVYHRKAFPITAIGNPGHGSRYVEFDAQQGKVVREWGMQ